MSSPILMGLTVLQYSGAKTATIVAHGARELSRGLLKIRKQLFLYLV